MKVWLDGGVVDAEAAKVSVFDHGITVGDGVFETLKVLDGTPFALTRHLRRLAHSARGIGLPAPPEEELRAAVAGTLEANAGALDRPLRMRVTLTGGPGPLGSDRGDQGPTLVLAVAPMTAWPETAAVAVVPWTRNERAATAGLKTTSYAENVVALARARSEGAGEAVLADTQGRLCEGTGSNVFVVLGGRVLTPSLDSGCLAGVTRALVLEWCDVEEADLPVSVLEEADEVFLTSSTRDVQGVHAVGARVLTTAPGRLTREVAEVFADRAAADADP